MNCSGLLMPSRERSSGVMICKGSALFEGSCLIREPVTIIADPSSSAATAAVVGALVGAVIVMRRKAPEIERPYRTLGYPIVPLVYIFLAVLFIMDVAYLAPSTSGIGFLIVFTGIPIYFIWRRSAAAASKDLDSTT